MFDFNKSSINGIEISELHNNSLLNFLTQVNQKTGELKENVQEASYSDFDFSIEKGIFINIQGSFHKYHNKGLHNYNDFSILDFCRVLCDLHNKFNLNPFLCNLHNIEFGVNVELPFDTNDLLNAIISYKGKEYEKRMYNGKGLLLRFSFQNYELKIYNKGLQYGEHTKNKNILRVEIKVKKMEYLHSRNINIHSFADLLNFTEINKLPTLLLTSFNELLIYDKTINTKELNKPNREILLNGRNPKYWTEIKKVSKEKFKHKRQRFRKLVFKYGKNNLQTSVYELIKNKLYKMLNIEPENEQIIHSFLKQFSGKTYPEITAFPSEPQNTNLPQSTTQCSKIERGILITEIKRFCKTCGRDITHQKKGSKFCSEKLYGPEVKKCRNIVSNPWNNYRRKEMKLYSGGGLLFDISTMKIPMYANKKQTIIV